MRVDPNWQTPTDMAKGQAMPVPQMAQPVTMASQSSGGNGFFDFLGGLGDLFADNAGTLAGIGSIAGALDNAGD